jgi:hypothetical protein
MILKQNLTIAHTDWGGGFSRTYPVSVQGDNGVITGLVYKEWLNAPTQHTLNHLGTLIQFRERLSAADRSYLDSVAAWPLSLVQDGKDISGFIMRRAPAAFMYQHKVRGLRTADLELLFGSAKVSRIAGAVVPDDSDVVRRLAIVTQLASALSWLHWHDCVFGDISHKNELFTFNPTPRIYLLDTDGISIPNSRVQTPSTDGYTAPERLGGYATKQSDVYKFTLSMVRVLADPHCPGISQEADPTWLQPTLGKSGVALASKALGAASGRPSMHDMHSYLYAALATKMRTQGTRMSRIAATFAARRRPTR